MAARPNVAAAEFGYIEMMFPDTLDPEISVKVLDTSTK
jgi:hypothetical protein